tara:strand:+ start:79482 stop:80618 length:1137 start_codon:yes stop_codon:yes gene_type:complete
MLSIGTTLNCLANIPSSSNSTATTPTDKLIQLQGEIKSLESELMQDQKSESMLNQNLAVLEVQIGKTLETLRQCQLQIKNISLEKNRLVIQVQKLKADQDNQKELLANLLQHIYTHAKRERWSMLLGQEDIYTLPRMNAYYHATSMARKEKIQQLLTQLQLSQSAQDKLLKTEQSLLALKSKTYENQQQLLDAQKTRQNILGQLKQRMNNQAHSLNLLKEERSALENVLTNLNQQVPTVPEYIEPLLKFSSQKERLSLPIQQNNTILTAVMKHTEKTAKKTYIKAAQGTPVHAIYHGKVVFSEWLRGVGLLLIIDHGNGYMSLYGNNQILYKSVGDSVEEGDIISRVGQSGGQTEPGLYFELRKDGIALEPSEWFKLS